MKSVTNDARQILVRVLLAQKDSQQDSFDRLGCNLINIVLDALGVEPDTLSRWSRECFFEKWQRVSPDQASIEKYLDWVAGQIDPKHN